MFARIGYKAIDLTRKSLGAGIRYTSNTVTGNSANLLLEEGIDYSTIEGALFDMQYSSSHIHAIESWT